MFILADCIGSVEHSLQEYGTENHTEKTVTLKLERTKAMSNAENFQWDYEGLTFLDNNIRHISV